MHNVGLFPTYRTTGTQHAPYHPRFSRKKFRWYAIASGRPAGKMSAAEPVDIRHDRRLPRLLRCPQLTSETQRYQPDYVLASEWAPADVPLPMCAVWRVSMGIAGKHRNHCNRDRGETNHKRTECANTGTSTAE